MSKVVQNARVWQDNWKLKRKQLKINKEQRYRKFLENPTRPLPSYESIVKWRNGLIIVCILIISIPSMQILFFFNSCYVDWTDVIPFVCTIVDMILAGFVVAFDFVIYRRWPEKKTFIHW